MVSDEKDPSEEPEEIKEQVGTESPFWHKVREFNRRLILPKWANRALRIFLGIFFGGFAIMSIILIRVYNKVPTHDELKTIENQTATNIYSGDGLLMGKYYLQDRTNVTYDQISPNIIEALIATEDARFYEHSGVDRKSLMRVLFKSILLNERSAGGGSTISQQLSKNLFPREGSGPINLLINKMREIITAWKLERIYNKEQILTFYLNTVSFGENAFGIHTATTRFFNKHPSEVGKEESALLVGMLKAPTAYNPRRNPERSIERRNVVLALMAEQEYISVSEKDSLQKLPIKLDYTYQTHNEGLAPYFREHLRQELEEWCKNNYKKDGNPYNLYTDGLKIYTTINSKMQKYAEQSVVKNMKELQKVFDRHWGSRNPWGRSNDPVMTSLRRSHRYRVLKDEGLSDKEIIEKFSEPVKMTLYTIQGEKTDSISPLDSIRHYLGFLHAGFLAVEAGTGHVLAWVGGIDHNFFKFDHVNINAKRQVGSTFKPIVYAAALESGVNTCEYFPNERQIYKEWQDWSPRNADGKYGGEYTMEGALTNSVNTVSAQLIIRAGINRVVSLARRMGIKSDLDPVPSLALGTADISLFEMVGAYTAFANNGVHTTPGYIDRIEDRDGNILWNPGSERSFNQAMSKNKAAVLTYMMEKVVNDGTASRIRWKYGIDGDVAGKTGTTQSQSDGWFIGFTPRIIAGAWVGADDRRVHFRSLSLGQGSRTALPIWGEFMASIKKDTSLRKYLGGNFDSPDDWMMADLDCEPYRTGPPDTTSFFDDLFYDISNFLNDPFSKDSAKAAEKEDRKARREAEREQKRLESEKKKKEKEESEIEEEKKEPGNGPVINIQRPPGTEEEPGGEVEEE